MQKSTPPPRNYSSYVNANETCTYLRREGRNSLRPRLHCTASGRNKLRPHSVATSATLPSLHDAGDNAFAEPRGQLVAGAQFLRPAHYAAIDVKRKRVSALQRIFRIEQRKLRANR